MKDIELLYGDCLELMKNIPDKSIDMVLCDPPYGTTACKWDSIIPFDKMWEQLNRIIKDNGAIVLFGNEPFSSLLRCSNLKNYKYDWIWNKENGGNFTVCKYRPLGQTENISVFGKNKINYYPIMEMTKEKNKRPRDKSFFMKNDNTQGMASGKFITSKNHDENLRYPKNLLTFNNRVGELNNINRLHPTQKPTYLLEYLIKTYTKENETVLDFTMGSGSTGVACINTNRNFIGIELDDKYFDIAKQRIENGFVQENISDNEFPLF